MQKRRIPVQARSRARYDAILEAAAELFAEQGFDATTVDQIAEQAGTSVGSIYQFFGNKQDVYRALATRCLERSDEAFDQLVGLFDEAGPWDQLVDLTVDGFAALLRADSTYRAVWMNFQLYGEFVEADAAMIQRFIETIATLLRSRSAALTLARARLVASVAVNAVSFLLVAALRQPTEEAEAMLAETKVMIRRYLAPVMADAD